MKNQTSKLPLLSKFREDPPCYNILQFTKNLFLYLFIATLILVVFILFFHSERFSELSVAMTQDAADGSSSSLQPDTHPQSSAQSPQSDMLEIPVSLGIYGLTFFKFDWTTAITKDTTFQGVIDAANPKVNVLDDTKLSVVDTNMQTHVLVYKDVKNSRVLVIVPNPSRIFMNQFD